MDAKTIDRLHPLPEPVLLHPENLEALHLLSALNTQWRTEGISTMSAAKLVYIGFDYSVIPATAEMMGLCLTPRLFSKLRAAETVICAIRNGTDSAEGDTAEAGAA